LACASSVCQTRWVSSSTTQPPTPTCLWPHPPAMMCRLCEPGEIAAPACACHVDTVVACRMQQEQLRIHVASCDKDCLVHTVDRGGGILALCSQTMQHSTHTCACVDAYAAPDWFTSAKRCLGLVVKRRCSLGGMRHPTLCPQRRYTTRTGQTTHFCICIAALPLDGMPAWCCV
jgi:hypothetical protein